MWRGSPAPVTLYSAPPLAPTCGPQIARLISALDFFTHVHEHSPCKHLRGHLLRLEKSQTPCQISSACLLASSCHLGLSLHPVHWPPPQGRDWKHVYLIECISSKFPSLRAAAVRILGSVGCKSFLPAWEAWALLGGPPYFFGELGPCPVRTVSSGALISWSPVSGGGKNLKVSASKLELPRSCWGPDLGDSNPNLLH